MMLQALRDSREKRLLRRSCEAKLASLSMPEPFSLAALVARVESARSRSIRLVAVEGGPDTDLRTACGLRIRVADATWILYRPRPTPHQTEHVILHELAHEWFDHGTTLPADLGLRGVPTQLRRALGEDLGGSVLVQARAGYGSLQEREAEISAYLIKQKALQSKAPEGEDAVSRLDASLSYPFAAPTDSSDPAQNPGAA